MTGFSFNAPTTMPDESISNDGFFPNLQLNLIRESVRLDGSVSNPRLKDAAIAAMLEINEQLRPSMESPILNFCIYVQFILRSQRTSMKNIEAMTAQVMARNGLKNCHRPLMNIDVTCVGRFVTCLGPVAVPWN